MKAVVRFIMKGIIKSKYTLLLPIAIIVLILSLFVMNHTQSGATQQELEETFKNRKITVDFLIGRALGKERLSGLTTEQRQSLDSLLIQEEYLKEISNKLKVNDLDIASAHLAYINEYEKYINLVSIPYNNQNLIEIEQRKTEKLIEHRLSYAEQVTPFNTALFTKQLFQLLFSPVTALLFLLIFSYKYVFDRDNRLFDFLKVNSLPPTVTYYSYLTPFLLTIVMYTVIVGSFSLLLPLVAGNINTLHYPIEVAVGTTIMMVPVWKWLIFLPISWGIFVSLLLILALCLLKQRISLGVTLAFIMIPLIISYIISLHYDFFMFNPIHLVISYEVNLLTSDRYITYLIWMFVFLLLCFILSTPVIKSQWKFVQIFASQMNKKQYHFQNKWRLFQFEHLKKKRKGHVLLTLLLLFGIMGSTVIVVNQQFQAIPLKALNTIEGFQSFLVELRTSWEISEEDFELEQQMQSVEENPYTTFVNELNNSYNMLESLKSEIATPDFPEKFRVALKSLDAPTYKEIDGALWTVTVMASEEQQHILDEKGIIAWPLGHQWISNLNTPNNATSIDQYKALQLLQERNAKYGNNGLFSVYKFLDWNIMLSVFAVFVLLLWTAISDERQGNLSIHFLATKPIHYKTIYMTKWLYNLAMTYSLLFISGVCVFLISIMIGGLGEYDYPILIYATERMHDNYFYSIIEDTAFYFESLSTLILKSGLLLVAQIFFLNSLFSLIGRWLKNHYAIIIITILIAVAGGFLGNHYIALNGMYINPFVYFDTWNVVDGWKSILASDSKVNYLTGTFILLIGGSILFCLGLLPRRRGTY